MTKTCIVCKKQPIPGDHTRSFHKFPANNELKQKWMQAIGVTDIKKISTVCSDHFEDDAYHQTDGYTVTKRLLSTAVPILNKCCIKNITNNIVIPSVVEETCDKICKEEVDEFSFNNSLELSTNTNNTTTVGEICNKIYKEEVDDLSFNNSLESSRNINNIVTDSSIQDNTYSSVNESDSLEDCDIKPVIESSFNDSTSQLEHIEKTSNDKNSTSSKRKRTINEAESDIPNKKFCFMDGVQPSHVSKQDFVSDEAWRRFVKLMLYKNRQIAGARKKSWRRKKQIGTFKELIKSLQDKNAFCGSEFLEVVL
ncbi:uncharacterized protein LOC128885902 [Hylaeus anthracinus]|uniref:uncharacterized protein LOC128885902 n=1 Tax=Hylaeus anthracinus TaxID=313031 RepID=UPI0023B9F9A2|nr:uncharacterized protein LOC128885902 [Hylaeus anthracinus]